MFSEKEKLTWLPMNLQLFGEEENKEEETDAGEENEDKGNEESSDKQKKGDSKTFTQAQLNKMMAREKQQGRQAALKELGIDPKDKSAVDKIKELIGSAKSDDEIAKEQSDAQNQKLVEAQRRALVAELKATAMQEGLQPKYVEDATIIVMAKLDEDADHDDFKTSIGELKSKYPNWFEDSEEGKAGKQGTGKSVKNLGKDSKDKEESTLGSRLAAQRKPKASQSSYWGGKSK